ncbi:MAG: EMC3/TMCO1 family protein [Candidatus Kariarchaeaceae archaeon]|jgi:uncharacterized membrane protein (DUF106 family)
MGLFSFLDPLSDLISDSLVESGLSELPGSAVVLLFVSLLISSFSGFVTRTLLDMETLIEQQNEISEHQRNKKMAMETQDKKLWIKVKRSEERFLELQRSMMTTRMLPSLITIGPFIFLFQTLRKAFQRDENIVLNGNDNCSSSCGVVTVIPFKFDSVPLIGNWFSPYAQDASISVAGFGFWYFLSAVVLSTILQRVFGINLTGMRNPMQQN